MDISDKRVAILVHNYFEQAEYEEPISALKDAGADVVVISADSLELQALNNVDFGDRFKADLLLKQASDLDYDGLVLPGGVVNSDNLRINLAAQEFVLEFLDNGRPIAAICHAPWLLVSAQALDGRRLTSYFTIRDDILNAGGEWVDLPVVVDDNLITSRMPDDLPYFNDQLISMLSSPDDSQTQEHFDVSRIRQAKNYRRRSLGRAKGSMDLLSDDEVWQLRAQRTINPDSMIPGQEED